jgi:hypothetical protein
MAALFVLLMCCVPAAAQTAPPIQGVTGTIATDETREAEHHAAGAIADGVKRVAGATKKLFSFGGAKATNENALDALIEGARVVLRDAADTAGASATEATVIDVNRRRQQITIRLGDRKTQTLRLTAPGANGDVVVTYTDAAGAKATGDFTRMP